MEICGDNRFEIIAKAKKHMLDATNIDTSPKEMEVLDNFLFRCWQMGWLDRYDKADTSQKEYEQGKRDALNEIIEYAYGMLTAEKVGLQHKIKSMMDAADTPQTEGESR